MGMNVKLCTNARTCWCQTRDFFFHFVRPFMAAAAAKAKAKAEQAAKDRAEEYASWYARCQQ